MLPIKTSPDNVVAVVDYLRTKATGATLDEAKATIDEKLLDGRKISAYESWGFVTREANHLRLAEAGRTFARANDEQRKLHFGDVIRRVRAYRLAAEWVFHQGFSTITSVDLAAHWYEHIPGELGTDNETTMRNQVICFFQLAEAAGLGTYVLGRGGQPTRLDFDRDSLGQFIAESGFEPPTPSEGVGPAPVQVNEQQFVERSDPEPGDTDEGVPGGDVREPVLRDTSHRVFISHGKNQDIVDQIRTMLELADLDYEVAVDGETPAIPVPEKVFDAMHRCTAAVICVTADNDTKGEDGSFRVNENVLIEIGAAFVLYDRRVVLVWDRRIPVPSNLQGLYRCEFEGDELSWSAGMRLMKAVNKFKRSA